jgi:hypothetical protein
MGMDGVVEREGLFHASGLRNVDAETLHFFIESLARESQRLGGGRYLSPVVV